ncbi:MAG: voltage-gated potassium channel [Thermoleophilaceae bacterium]|jgi:ABC-type transporter Mla maintaining outer membrane lipid asymmetry permease subunit MlaE|nr:voltage-gated potassium channel [Thermoleophilaceae bacterium]
MAPDTWAVVRDALKKAAHEVHGIASGRTPTHSVVRDRLVALLVVSIVLDLIAAIGMVLFERDAAGTAITNFGDAIFWTSAQMLTVSSQMPNPVTTPGRVLDIFLEAYALIIVSTMAGMFGAFFHARNQDERKKAAAGAS